MPSKSSVLSWKNYYTLCKPNVVAEMLFYRCCRHVTCGTWNAPVGPFIYGTLGIALAASSAAAVNHFIDPKKRTHKWPVPKKRPLPTGELNFD